jgi:mono/diheme cytochrome c family protein
MTKSIQVVTAGISIFLLAMAGAACGGASAEGAATTSASSGDQAGNGKQLFAKNCASCHGAAGEGGGQVPALVGKTALPLDPPSGSSRKAKFHTAADVFQYVKANMPPGGAGSLTDEQYAAILAFDLKANGVDLTGKKVDPTTAPTFVLHP